MKINKKSFIFLIIIGFILHLSVFLIPLFDDSTAIAQVLTVYKETPKALLLFAHPPLGLFLYILPSKIFGISDFSIRLVSFVFNILTFFLIYIFTKKYYDKNTAKISLLLCFYTFFPFAVTSIVDIDGSIVTFFLMLGLLSLYNYLKKKNNKCWGFLSVLSFGILLTLKIRNIFLLIPLIILILYQTKSIKRTFKYLVFLIIIIFVILSINLIILNFLSNNQQIEILNQIFKHTTSQNIINTISAVQKKNFTDTPTIKQIKIESLFKYFNLLIVLSPLYLFLPLLQITKFSKKDFIIIIWLSYAFFVFLGYPTGFFFNPRYISIIYPFFVILSSVFINNYKLKIDIKKTILFIISLVFIIPLQNIFSLIKLNNYWTFMVIDGVFLDINLAFLIFYYLLNLLLIILYLKINKKEVILFFILLNIFFNIFLIISQTMNNDYRTIIKDLKEYADNKEIYSPIYTWHEDVPYYVNVKKLPMINFFNPISNITKEDLKHSKKIEFYTIAYKSNYQQVIEEKKNGTIILMTYPKNRGYPSLEEIKDLLINCTKELEKNYKRGDLAIYRCI